MATACRNSSKPAPHGLPNATRHLAGNPKTKNAQSPPTLAEIPRATSAKVVPLNKDLMDIVPLALVISLCLTFTFIVFFAREQARRRFGSAESESLLPLLEEKRAAHAPAVAPAIVVDMSQVRPRCRDRHTCTKGERCEHRGQYPDAHA